ncbi:MAG: glycosyltransferase [Pseudomonadota bacterium]
MTKTAPKLSTLAIQHGMLWGWASVPDKPLVDVHLYFDGRHVASEFSGQLLPASVQRLIGKPPHTTAGFCFALPAATSDGFEHTLQVALPNVNDDGLYSQMLTLPAGEARGEIRQQWRLLVGTVWFASEAPRQRSLRIADSRGRLLHTKLLKPSVTPEAKGYPATFSIPLAELPAGELHISCAGQPLRGSPYTPIEFVVGALETCTTEAISGWAFNGTDPLKPIELALRIDGKVVQWFRPNMLRTDLSKELQLPDEAMGIAGFHLPPPAILFDGFPHWVEVVGAASGYLLSDGQRQVRWSYAGEKLSALASSKASITKQNFPAPKVSVVVLNRNGARVLEAMLASWERYNRSVPAELIIIDHASTDSSLVLLKRWRQRLDLKIVPLKQNDSFSDSSNRGARMARGEYVLFMNNDIQWLQDALPRMLESLQDPSVGIVGMKLLKVVGESSVGGQHASEVQHLGVRFTLNDQGYWPYEVKPDFANGEEEYSPQTVPAVTGAALLCRKVDFDAVGGFHTDYFYGFEDVELCIRLAERLNKKVICRNDCVALHHHGHTRLSGRERSIFDRLMRNSSVLESHIGLWIKQAYWRSLLSGDGFHTNERLRIALIGNADSLATSLLQALPHADILLLTSANDWKRVDNLHVLIVGDPRYDIRSLQHARVDLFILAWVKDAAAEWKALPWWSEFAGVLVPSASATRLQKALQRPVQTSTPEMPLGPLLDPDATRLRVVIRAESTDSDMQKRALLLRNHLHSEAVPCWLQNSDGLPIRVADVCVTLTRKASKRAIETRVVTGMLQVTLPLTASLPSAVWLKTELEKQVGSTFQSP